MNSILQPPIFHPLPYRLFLFDADGTLRRCTVPGQPCPNQPGEWVLAPNVGQTLALNYLWSRQGVPRQRSAWGIVSNQGGVALGYLNEDLALKMLKDTALACQLPMSDEYPFNIFVCYHAPAAGCKCRKPSPCMLFEAMAFHSIDWLAQVLYVGDLDSDREAAARAGIDFCWAQDFFGWSNGAEHTN